ncbi:MAG: class I SAM-dependent methyltransferase [Bacillota bacterium]
MSNMSRAWDWSKDREKIWFTPCEESFFLINRWKEKGFRRFLDLGCGRGRHSIQFARAGFYVSALDLSHVAVSGLDKWAKEEGLYISAVVGDMADLPFPDGAFDCLMAYHVMSHTDSRGIIRILSEMGRVLKDGGEFFITLCSKNTWSFQAAGFPRLDENTVIKLEEGPENGIPHFYVDEDAARRLLSSFKLITLRHIQDIDLDGGNRSSWHYFVLGAK